MPPSTARLQANNAGLSEQDQCAERGLPTIFLRSSTTPIGQYTCFFDDCSSRHTQQGQSWLPFTHTEGGGVKLGGIMEESHTTPITFNEASGRRPRSMPSLPANPTTRSSDLGLEIPVPISCFAPDLHRPSSPFQIVFHFFLFFFFKGGKRRDGRYSPLSLMSFATLLGELHNLFLGQCGLKPM